MLRLRDIMTTDVLTVTPETSVRGQCIVTEMDIAKAAADHRLTGR